MTPREGVLLVGLTGGIATGKSTVAATLRAMGIPVIDADAVAREIVAAGEPALARIVEAFGPGALSPDGTLDRAAMRRRIAADPAARRTLEAITHGAIRDRIGKQAAELASDGHRAVVVEAALLVETGSYRDYPVLIVVTCSPETQLRRLVDRDGTAPEEARALIAAQLPMGEKEAMATHVVRNDGDLAALDLRTRALWDTITRR